MTTARGATHRSRPRALRSIAALVVGATLVVGACSDDGDDAATSTTTAASAGTTSTTATSALDITRPFGPHTPPVESLDRVEMAFEVRIPRGATPELEYAQEEGDGGFEEYAGVFDVDGRTMVVSQALADAPTTSTGEPRRLANGEEALVTDSGGVVSVAWSERRDERYLRIVVYGASGEVTIDDVVAFAGTVPGAS